MSHTAGVIRDGGDGSLLFEALQAAGRSGSRFANGALIFQLGAQYRNSPHDWIRVSAAIEAAANQWFPVFMRERVFEPLGMYNTVSEPAAIERDEDHPLFNLIRDRIIRCARSISPATRDRAHFCPRRPTWCASRSRSTRASCCSPTPFNWCRHHSGWRQAFACEEIAEVFANRQEAEAMRAVAAYAAEPPA